MANKNKHKETKVSKKKGRRIVFWIAGAISIVILILLASGNFPFSSSSENKGKSFYVKGGETRPVLSPSLFTGMARKAYIAANKYRGIMDKVYCYCYCEDPPFSHKSLLSCFVDEHASV